MLDDCRKVLEDFRKRNKWSKRQKETVRRLDRDGERFLRLFVDETAGELNVRFVEPLEIQNPPGKSAADGVYFGIQYARVGEGLDVETPVNYFLVQIGTLGESIGLRETVPARHMQHLKANVDMTWPRGLPTWYALQVHLSDAVQTLKATGKIVEFRARIGMIRRHINATKERVRMVVDSITGGKAAGDGGRADGRAVPLRGDHRLERRHRVPVPFGGGPGRQERGRHPGRVAGCRGGLGDAGVHAFRRRLQRQFLQHDGGRRPGREDFRGVAGRSDRGRHRDYGAAARGRGPGRIDPRGDARPTSWTW